VLDVDLEPRGADAAFDQQAGADPVEPQRADRRPGPPAIARGTPDRALAAGRPRVPSHQAEVAAGLIDEHQALRVDARNPRTPGLPRGFVPLGGSQGLFC
jgi:hypothetical protein